jgi:hypothetical protein
VVVQGRRVEAEAAVGRGGAAATKAQRRAPLAITARAMVGDLAIIILFVCYCLLAAMNVCGLIGCACVGEKSRMDESTTVQNCK